MISLLSYIFWLVILAVAASRFIETLPADLRDVATYGFWGHALAAPALIFVALTFLNGGGDLNVYYTLGSRFTDALYSDFGRWAGELLKLSVRIPGDAPFNAHGIGRASATGAMFSISSWLLFFTGKSFAGAGLLVAVMGFASRVAIFMAIRERLPRELHRLALICCIAVPSGVFWTAGLLKEGIAMTGFGWCVYGLSRIAIRQQWIRGVLIFLIGAVPIYAVKVYILIPLVVAGSVWIAAEAALARSETGQLKIRPIYFVLGVGAGVLGMYVLGILAPQYSFMAVSEELVGVQTAGAKVGGNTNYSLGQVSAAGGLQAQLALAPLALIFALMRPFFFEISSIQVLVNAMESTVLSYFLLRLLIVTRPAKLFTQALRSPSMLAFLVFVLLFGTFVGLGSTNVGSLSRYRAPMMPMYAVILFVIPKLVELREKSTAAVPIVTEAEVEMTPAQRRRRRRLGLNTPIQEPVTSAVRSRLRRRDRLSTRLSSAPARALRSGSRRGRGIGPIMPAEEPGE